MPPSQLMGARVEVAEAGFSVADPVVDVPVAGGHLVAAPTQAILRVDGLATFAIAKGSVVRIDPDADAPEATLSAWLHGSVAALVLAQRGLFALHASAVQVGGVGVALAGARGSGKSTTALRLTQRGHSLVADDVSPLDTNGQVTTHPFSRPVHIDADTAARLGIDVSGAEPVVPTGPKLALPSVWSTPAPVGAIVVLEPSATVAAIKLVQLRGVRAHWMVGLNLYRLGLLRNLYQTQIFEWMSAVARKVPVHVATRPADGWTVDAVADAVERVATAHRP